MAQGLQTFQSDGTTVDVEITDRLPRLLDVVSIGGSATSGRIYNSAISANVNIWWFMISAATDFSAASKNVPTYEHPEITQGDGYLDWKFPKNRNLTCNLLYGVY